MKHLVAVFIVRTEWTIINIANKLDLDNYTKNIDPSPTPGEQNKASSSSSKEVFLKLMESIR